MFSRRIIKTDWFTDMPDSAQNLYFHLCLDADDDGFVSNPTLTMKSLGTTADSLKLLIAKKMLMPFPSGILLVKHWRIHNEIKKDRYKPTTHSTERDQVKLKDNGAYSLEEGTPLMQCFQDGDNVYPQVRLDKVRLDKVSKEDRARHDRDFERVWSIYPRKVGKQAAKRWWSARYFPKEIVQQMLEAIPQQQQSDQWKKGFIPHPTTWFNRGGWEDQIENNQIVKPAFKSYKT